MIANVVYGTRKPTTCLSLRNMDKFTFLQNFRPNLAKNTERGKTLYFVSAQLSLERIFRLKWMESVVFVAVAITFTILLITTEGLFFFCLCLNSFVILAMEMCARQR